MTASQLTLSLRNGAVLATLATIPILVGFGWSAIWGEPGGVSSGTIIALLLAWLACTGVVTIQSFIALREHKTLAWFYPCTRCKHNVAIISYRCTNCKQPFTIPPEGIAFRNLLLLGVAVFYATFALGAFLLRVKPI